MTERPMSRAAAQEFSESFGMIGAGWWRQVAWAAQQGIPDALGLSTREWVEHYVGGWARLAIEDRREAVRELTGPKEDGGLGMTQREAADVLGVGVATVHRDLEPVPNGTEPLQFPAREEVDDVPDGTEPPSSSEVFESAKVESHVLALSSLRTELKPRDVAAGLRVSNRGAFAKRLKRVAAYLESIAQQLEESAS